MYLSMHKYMHVYGYGNKYLHAYYTNNNTKNVQLLECIHFFGITDKERGWFKERWKTHISTWVTSQRNCNSMDFLTLRKLDTSCICNSIQLLLGWWSLSLYFIDLFKGNILFLSAIIWTGFLKKDLPGSERPIWQEL